MGQLNIYDQLRVAAGSFLSNDDIQVLSLLYQPIIGTDGFALYFALYGLLDREKMTSNHIMHKELLDILNLKLNSFLVARIKLEAVGLLRALKGENDYVYFLNAPLSSKVFMSGALGPFLYSKIGDTLFKNLYNRFSIEKIKKDEYIEITKNFDDVFESKNITINNEAFLLEKKTGKIKINNSNFDMDSFLNGIKAFIDRRRITEKFKNNILRLAYIYGFDYQEMINICMSAYNGEVIVSELLNKKSRDYYQSKNKAKTPNLVLKEVDYSNDEKVNFLLSTTPKEILETFSGMGACVSELDNINVIWEKTGWDKGVINAFILYIMKKKNGQLPSFNYLDKVASEWKRMGINDVSKASSYLETEAEPIKKVESTNEEKSSDWLDDWYKKLGELKDE